MSPMLKYKDPADGLWKPVPVGGGGGPVAMDDLTDADTTTVVPAIGDILEWNGTNWVPSTPAAGATLPTAGAGLTGGAVSYDVGQGTGITVAADTVALDTAYTNTLYSPTTHVHSMDSLTDADTTTIAPTAGFTLQWDGTNWVPGPNLTKTQADTDYVNVIGDTMTGHLNMTNSSVVMTGVNGVCQWLDNDSFIGGSQIGELYAGVASTGLRAPINVGEPTSSQHATTKAYVDRTTGWRDIGSMVGGDGGWLVDATGHCYLIRIGYQVFINAYALGSASALPMSGVLTGLAPAGFVPAPPMYLSATTVPFDPINLVVVPDWLAIVGSGAVANDWVQFYNYPAGFYPSFTLSYITQDPWPVSLPGAPALLKTPQHVSLSGGQP